jgi:hypothetical protein
MMRIISISDDYLLKINHNTECIVKVRACKLLDWKGIRKACRQNNATKNKHTFAFLPRCERRVRARARAELAAERQDSSATRALCSSQAIGLLTGPQMRPSFDEE